MFFAIRASVELEVTYFVIVEKIVKIIFFNAKTKNKNKKQKNKKKE